MMPDYPADGGDSFVIPARTLRGSKREMVEDIDQAIVGLLALRHLVGAGGSPVLAPALQHGGKSALHRACERFGLRPARLTEWRESRGNPEAS
jgi:hypothetical protein